MTHDSQLAALGAAIGKVPDYDGLIQEAGGRFPTVHARLAANDNLPSVIALTGAAGSGKTTAATGGPLLLGITGRRNVGKSTVATLLEERYGFARAHAFDGGKEAARAYFAHITGGWDLAQRMVYGNLKDEPSPHLPGNVAPRFFLEKFGQFMGVTMGAEWTLAMEIARIRRESPRAPIVVESLVYEAPWFKAQGGVILRLERPDFEGPEGIESDSVQAAVEADHTITAATVEELEHETEWLLFGLESIRRAA